MFKIVLVAVFAALAVGNLLQQQNETEASPRLRVQVPQLDGRIVGGVDTTIEDYPHQISLMYFTSHICGGSIIARNLILTAAHCTYGQSARVLKVRYGSSVMDQGGKVVAVVQINDHPKYNPSNIDYDVSVLKLAEDVVLSSNAQIIEMVSSNTQEGGRNAFVSGWGALYSGGPSPNQLQVVEVAEEDRAACNRAYGGKITDRMICFKNPGKDSCQGDSGGPLVSGGVQIGVVSWGYGCAHVIYPGVNKYSTNLEILQWTSYNSACGSSVSDRVDQLLAQKEHCNHCRSQARIKEEGTQVSADTPNNKPSCLVGIAVFALFDLDTND
ncbi:hypothetical protein PPYR_11215 [Photinus pyralis]|uniref:Peptidase S1 domain-containing protein n=1 Tax=Photinus pyralis TaxID=7054 RepID=A0A5N4AAM0_PHOPY|nr:hypothetical protein PPYR_11215 [Photinus pyralis]